MGKRIGLILAAGIFVFAVSGLSLAEETTSQVVKQEAVDVGNKICPVSGQKIDEKFKATYEYEGKIYNFCCSMCIDTFKSSPAKYIEKVEKELAEQKIQEEDSAPIPEMPVSHQH